MEARSRVWLEKAEDMGAADNRGVKTLFVVIVSFTLLVDSGIITHAWFKFHFLWIHGGLYFLHVRRGHPMISLTVRARQLCNPRVTALSSRVFDFILDLLLQDFLQINDLSARFFQILAAACVMLGQEFGVLVEHVLDLLQDLEHRSIEGR
jgi:hypothetical protein